LEVVEEIRPVERPDVEVLRSKLVLGEQELKTKTGLSLRVQDSL